MKRIAPLLFLLVGALVGLLGGAVMSTAKSEVAQADYGQVLASAGDTNITRGHLAEYAIESVGKQILINEMRKIAVVEEAARLNGITATPAEVEQRVKESFDFAENTQVAAQMKAEPRPLLADRLRAVLLEEKMLNITANENDGRAFYTKHPQMFIHPARVKLICVACDTEERAANALGRLKNGEDPNTVSSEESDDKDLKENKGEVGWFTQSQMSPEVAKAIFGDDKHPALQVKQFSNVIRYTYDNVVKQDQHEQFLVFYVSDLTPAVINTYDTAAGAALFYARADKYLRLEPAWYHAREQEITYKVREDLFDENAKMIVLPAQALQKTADQPAPQLR